MKRFGMLALMAAAIWAAALGAQDLAPRPTSPLDEAVARTKKHRDGGSKDEEEHEEELTSQAPFEVLARR